MKTRHLVFTFLPAIAVADEATTVPANEPMLPPLPAELLAPHEVKAGLPATAQPIVAYKAPDNEEQTWLKLLPVRASDDWPGIFHRIADSIIAKDMEMCHGYALWLKGKDVVYLRYDDDLSLSGIHADGHSYGVLYVEFSPYGVRVCPMEGYDLSKKQGGVCWQDAPTKLWSWADSAQFWTELPKLLRADKRRGTTSAQNTAISREVSTKGQRMVIFWATPGFAASAWWANFQRLYEEVGPRRFSLIAPEGLKFLNDVQVPGVKPAATPTPPPAANPPAAGTTPATGTAPATGAAPTAKPAPPNPPATEAAAGNAAKPATAKPAATAQGTTPAKGTKQEEPHPIPDVLHPATGSPKAVAPPASVRPWDESVEKVPAAAAAPAAKPSTAKPAAAAQAAAPAATPAKGTKQEEPHPIPDVLHPATGSPKAVAPPASVRPWDESIEKAKPAAPRKPAAPAASAANEPPAPAGNTPVAAAPPTEPAAASAPATAP